MIDTIFFKEGSIYKLIRRFPLDKYLGTMLLECFGAPILKGYTRRQVETLAQHFRVISLRSIGNNLPCNIKHAEGNKKYESPFGVFWRLELEKENPP